MATDWSGYSGDWQFADWENEVLAVSARPATGHTLTSLATGVAAKADGEKQGLGLSGAGTAFGAYERKFFFAAAYRNAAGSTLNPRSDSGNDLLALGNVLTDADGREWGITSVVDPGGAAEHYEVTATRRMS